MEHARIAELLQPFLQTPIPRTSLDPLSFQAGFSPEESAVLTASQIENISTYIDLLLRWNARVNLTAVRDPEEIVTRHFGESLLAARYLFPSRHTNEDLTDFGSGAGFPGLPIKIWVPDLRLTLIESNHKKATFLREVVRKLAMTNVEVFSGRAEDYVGQADVVTLRAVERFEQAVPLAVRLVRPGGRLTLLIGEAQIGRARALAPSLEWSVPVGIPLSSSRVVLVGRSSGDTENQFRHESRK
jgi:16S rRNA (guanine527-N7)-methyltransferase